MALLCSGCGRNHFYIYSHPTVTGLYCLDCIKLIPEASSRNAVTHVMVNSPSDALELLEHAKDAASRVLIIDCTPSQACPLHPELETAFSDTLDAAVATGNYPKVEAYKLSPRPSITAAELLCGPKTCFYCGCVFNSGGLLVGETYYCKSKCMRNSKGKCPAKMTRLGRFN